MRLAELPAYGRLPLDVVAAEGCELVLADGSRVLDLYGGHCVCTLGSGDAHLGDALLSQWQQLPFVTNLIDHDARSQLLAALEPGMPAGDWRLFCSNSGAEANENLLKMALALTGRETVVAFEGAFHGRTAAAAAVSDGPPSGFPRAPFDVRRLPWGSSQGIDEAVAAVVLEPVQSLAGIVEPPRGFLEELRLACSAHGALLLFDEVQTGNGRCGEPWASVHFGVTPDGFSTAKGAAGGLPVGFSFLSADAAERLPSGLLGSTFGGGPTVLAAAAEVARRANDPAFLETVAARGAALREAVLGSGLPVRSVRGAGLLLGVELEPPLLARGLRDALLERGVLCGLSNDPSVLRLSPPLTLAAADVVTFGAALQSCAEELACPSLP